MSNNTVVRGLLVPSLKNKPLDGRQDVPTLADIVNIENPYVNFIFPVAETGKWYKVVSLTDKVIDELVIPNGMVDEYEEFGGGMTDAQKQEYLTKSLAEQVYLKKEDAVNEYLNKTEAEADYLKKKDAEEAYQPKGDYQQSGDYATKDELNDLRNEVTTKECAVEVAISDSEPTLDDVKIWIDTSKSSSGGSDDEDNEDNGDNDSTQNQYETVNVSISANNGASITANVTVNGETKSVTSGSSVPFEVEYGIEYTIEVGAVDGFVTPSALTFTSEQSTRNVELVYDAVLFTVTRIDQNIADPDTMITRIVDNGAIQAIRVNSHRYTGKVNDEGVMVLKQLDDADGTKYLDGTDAELTTLGVDVWMKLPQFYWKNVKVEDDVFDFYLAYGEKPDDSYNTWEGDEMIGVYKSVTDSSTGSRMAYSVSDLKFDAGDSSSSLSTCSSRRGDRFSCITYNQHCMMAMLFYSFYLTTDFKSICGNGLSVSGASANGDTNILGMTDTNALEHDGVLSVNFWGLEKYWDQYNRELMNGITYYINSSDDDDGYVTLQNPTRVFTVYNSLINVVKMVLGKYIDLLPSSDLSATTSLGYCSQCILKYGTSYVLRTGLAGLEGAAMQNQYSRLSYKGEYIVES